MAATSPRYGRQSTSTPSGVRQTTPGSNAYPRPPLSGSGKHGSSPPLAASKQRVPGSGKLVDDASPPPATRSKLSYATRWCSWTSHRTLLLSVNTGVSPSNAQSVSGDAQTVVVPITHSPESAPFARPPTGTDSAGGVGSPHPARAKQKPIEAKGDRWREPDIQRSLATSVPAPRAPGSRSIVQTDRARRHGGVARARHVPPSVSTQR